LFPGGEILATQVACVWADLISYVITRPIIIGSVFLSAPCANTRRRWLRPVEPPTPIFFVRHEQFADSRMST
jgi:hypothetical protein